ncbi:MAG: hypothetical protein MR755_07730 [Faecalibacterium sp.]|nr:hypothetical protein [Faecalibacterium sp.]
MRQPGRRRSQRRTCRYVCGGILFIGIITQDVINQTKSESLVGSFVDTAAAAAEVGKICNAHNSIDIDFTVLLTHIGFEEDRHLARQLDPAWGWT